MFAGNVSACYCCNECFCLCCGDFRRRTQRNSKTLRTARDVRRKIMFRVETRADERSWYVRGPCYRCALAGCGIVVKVETAACAHASSCARECLYSGEGIQCLRDLSAQLCIQQPGSVVLVVVPLSQPRKPIVVYRVDARVAILPAVDSRQPDNFLSGRTPALTSNRCADRRYGHNNTAELREKCDETAPTSSCIVRPLGPRRG
ncbi:unnamed protein product [Ectocarpus sp. 12 AP-2014]